MFKSCVRISICLCTTLLALAPVFAGELGARRGELQAFQPSGHTPAELADPMKPDLLPANVQYPPTGRNLAILRRTGNCAEFLVKTSGLPSGAYTVWLVGANNPDKCGGVNECDIGEFFDDIFANPDTDPFGFWATGGIVEADGLGEFRHRTCRGDDLGFPGDWMVNGDISRCQDGEACTQARVIGPQHLFGELKKPTQASYGLIIKYHGTPSDDPVTFYDQTHTLLGSCAVGANGHPQSSSIIQCFDPQIGIFPAVN